MNLTMRYGKPAQDSHYGWEHQSLPIGNGWLGANIFGGIRRDRIQITENSLENPGELGGLNNFAELYLHFDHQKVTEYERGLSLDDAIAYTAYRAEGVRYRRTYFASYPHGVLVIRLTGDKPFDLGIELEVPYCAPYAQKPEDGGGKTGRVSYEGNRAHLSGRMDYYNVRFAGELAVTADGKITAGRLLQVEAATQVTVFLAVGSNYALGPEVFVEDDPKKKLPDTDPREKVAAILENALEKGYDPVLQGHLQDYRNLFGRVALELGEKSEKYTDRLLKEFAWGRRSKYLQMLYFQYGRYLLISSSRKGTLPANLQGVWNVHQRSPWGSGYWHNINVQMNYWPAFSTNLAETFAAYVAFNEAFRPKGEQLAREYLKTTVPEEGEGEDCGWTVGTGVYPYSTEGPGGHSGPGTGGLTGKLFWDYYDFTREEQVLRENVYPALAGMSAFLTRTVRKGKDGIFRAVFSASPEQTVKDPETGWKYYRTVGCAFDQQMIWESGRDFLQAARRLQATDTPAFARQAGQMDAYHPVRLGCTGQIKEFEEEGHYGQIGEYRHRHISQLVGLHPGTLINHSTPAWMDAAKITLRERGDRSTGWALAHRMNAWARTGDGDHAYKLLCKLIGKRTMENLWDFHPPFQIDGNFGGTAGIAEMLLQSHEGCIRILPALPKAWEKKGSFRGLVARGAFETAVSWENGKATRIEVLSKAGGLCVLRYPGIEGAALSGADAQGEENLLRFQTQPGQTYVIRDIPRVPATPMPGRLRLQGNTLRWKQEAGVSYRVYRNGEDAPDYTLLGQTEGDRFAVEHPQNAAYALYKVTARRPGALESQGAVLVWSPEEPVSRLRRRGSRLWTVAKTEFLGECYDFGMRVIHLLEKWKGKRHP